MGARGAKVKDITAEHDVQIKFPDRENSDVSDAPLTNGEDGQSITNDIIRITGRPENCEAAKNALLELVSS